MKRDCSTCAYKEGSCYPSTTIFDKDKTCKSYEPDYEEYITDLEKENTNLKDVIEGYKKIAKWCDKCDQIAELKLENQKWKDEWQEKVQEATDEGYARTLQTMQLNKAKQFIRDFLSVAIDYIDPIDKNYSLIAEAEQFLKENSTYERIQKAKYNYTD